MILKIALIPLGIALLVFRKQIIALRFSLAKELGLKTAGDRAYALSIIASGIALILAGLFLLIEPLIK